MLDGGRSAYFRNYIAMINNSVGTKMFRNFFLDGKDITENGNKSCAYFVSSILYLANSFKLIESPHITVSGMVKDMMSCGWKEVSVPEIGSVLIWEKQETGHNHIGFFMGYNVVINNSPSRGIIERSHWTFNDTRKIEKILWHPCFSL